MRAEVRHHMVRLSWKVSKVFNLIGGKGGKGVELSLKSVIYLTLFLENPSHKNTFNLIASLAPLYI